MWRHLYVGAALAVLSILIYVTSSVLLLIAGIQLLIIKRIESSARKVVVFFFFKFIKVLPCLKDFERIFCLLKFVHAQTDLNCARNEILAAFRKQISCLQS